MEIIHEYYKNKILSPCRIKKCIFFQVLYFRRVNLKVKCVGFFGISQCFRPVALSAGVKSYTLDL